MSDYIAAARRVERERKTAERIQKVDTHEIVDEIHDLEDEAERLRAALRDIVAEDDRLNAPDAEYDLDDVFLRVVGIAKEALGNG
jgi:hypothetical protein